jgi:hypothetical protein
MRTCAAECRQKINTSDADAARQLATLAAEIETYLTDLETDLVPPGSPGEEEP